MSAVAFADLEALLVPWLAGSCGCRVVTDLPARLEDHLPVLQINRIGGHDPRPRLDFAIVDVDAYGADRAAAVGLAETARAELRQTLPGQQLGGALITRVDTLDAPSLRPYDNTALRRFGATYRLIAHHVG